MGLTSDLPFFASIPHSGEQIPEIVGWLKGLSEETLMRDVDRFVDILYGQSLNELKIPSIVTPWHRYVVDLNRKPNEFDEDSVVGAPFPAGTHPKGLHWSVTTHKERLISEPMTMELHDELVASFYKPFHDSVLDLRKAFKDRCDVVYHLDLHSMPSLGTDLHPDPGETRAEVVISDQHGASCDSEFKNLVMRAYQNAGFQVAYNWPYVGGGITKTYGAPDKGFNTVQVELNRAEYMNEETKKLEADKQVQVQAKLKLALREIQSGIKDIMNG